LGHGIDRVLEVGTAMQPVVHVIGKVATVAAIEKCAYRFQRLVIDSAR
jgi:hypothetical protein